MTNSSQVLIKDRVIRFLVMLASLIGISIFAWFFFLRPPWYSPNKWKVEQTMRHLDCYKDLIHIASQDFVFEKLWEIRNLGYNQPADTLSPVNGVYRLLEFHDIPEVLEPLSTSCTDTFDQNQVPKGLRIPNRNTIAIEIATFGRHLYRPKIYLYGKVRESHILIWHRDSKRDFDYRKTFFSFDDAYLVRRESLDSNWTYLIMQTN